MKRGLAIFLISVHMMNIIGNYGFVSRIAAVHEKTVSDQLDRDEYIGSDAITLKVPFSLPYSTNSKNYERAIGKIQYEGQTYHMVKHKFHNDTLFIVCFKDTKLTRINETLTDLAASMADTPDKNEHSGTSKAIMQVKDFEECAAIQLSKQLIQLQSMLLPAYFFSVIISSESSPDQPPKA